MAMTRRIAVAACAALSCSASGVAFAGGFEIHEESAAGTGMAGAFAAKADDASAIFYNPAGIALQPGGGVILGGSIAFQGFKFNGNDGSTSESALGKFYLPAVYLSAHAGKYVALGVGLFTQFGAGVTWNDTGTARDGSSVKFPGRFLTQAIDLKTSTINPTFAFRPIDHMAFGVGLDVLLVPSVTLTRSIPFADQEGTAQLGGSANGVGFNAGVLVDIVPRWLSIGIAYRSSISFDADMKAHFDKVPPELKDNVYDQKAKTSLTMPHNLSFGLATFPVKGLSITADVHWTLWGDFKDLVVTFPAGSKTPGFTSHQGWQDDVSIRVGMEYWAFGKLALRLGVGYETTAIPAQNLQPSAPLSDKVLVAAGVGYKAKGFGAAVGYLAGITLDYKSTNPDLSGTYPGGAGHIITISLSYEWGKGTLCAHCGRSCTGDDGCCDMDMKGKQVASR